MIKRPTPLISAALPLLLFAALVLQPAYSQKQELRQSVEKKLSELNAETGVAVIHLASGDTFNINGHKAFPMQSVFKFPLAMAVLRQVDDRKLTLDHRVNFTKAGRIQNTWSPLAKKYPDDVVVSLEEMLESTVSLSDNNGCDFIFREIGGPAAVNRYVQDLIPGEMVIRYTEQEMHDDWNRQFANSTTPIGLANLFRMFRTQNILSNESRTLLWGWMVSSPTGAQRIKGKLPDNVVVAHKTGTGGVNDDHIIGAVNDAGIIVLPDGSDLILVILVSKARGEYEAIESVIAEISREIYDYYVSN